MTIIVDYDAGNLRSMETALAYLGVKFRRSSAPDELEQADQIILPGVGRASHAMKVLRNRGLDIAIQRARKARTPILGVCIGCQLILEFSEEDATNCLAIIEGEVKYFPQELSQGERNRKLKVPHIGWNEVEVNTEHPAQRLFDGIAQNSSFYFVNSLYPAPKDPNVVLGTSEYGLRFASVIAQGNLIACQFHPEKSGEAGLQLLANFCQKFEPS